jgi:diaminohydroxyphosphoribosylaminopyrimidine deaminase / 5-amino-6-(5-phosphoribosylamino)uracil reductase
MLRREIERFMGLAIKQAEKGKGKTGNNPVVGCIIVKNKKVISSGFHKKFGGPHAEIIALKKAGNQAQGATLFVTLEPCAYYGKTPPCVAAIIRAGIKQVVCAGKDPNPLNNGKGIKALRAAGIHVFCGVLRHKAELLNLNFIERFRMKKPLVTLKLAQSIDGKIATRKNDSMWISSKASREFVQGLRKSHDAIMVGINTVLCDDPCLSIRYPQSAKGYKKRQPVKIIVDTNLKTPVNARILSKLSPGNTIIAAMHKASADKEKILKSKGADIIRIRQDKKGLNLVMLMERLVEKGIHNILLEGGSELAASMLEKSLVDRVYFFISPIIIGGRHAIGSVGGLGVDRISDAIRLSNVKTRRIDKDILVQADVYRHN